MKFAVTTAIDGAARLERMATISQRPNVPRLMPQPARPGVVAVCGYGPSLQESWKEIATPFICTTSGAHDLLLSHDITPKWHVEYDPRPHKLEFLQNSQPETTYCLASTCNPKMFDLLKHRKLLLWHALGPDLQEDAELVHKYDEDGIMLFGGSNAGARAIMVMHCLGFRAFDLHAFDCSYRPDTCWAGPHSGNAHTAFEVLCNGKKFLSSDIMLNSAEEIFRTMFGHLRGCNFRVFGDGILLERIKLLNTNPELAQGQWWTPVNPADVKKIAIHPIPQIEAVITEGYRQQNHIMHQWNPDYGSYGAKHATAVKEMIDALGTQDVLDYGCGKCKLQFGLGFPIKNYDPAIPEFASLPEPADFVTCTDVLEHIEPECLGAVLADLKRVVRKHLFVSISTVRAVKTLPDGRNAHLLIHEAEWWRGILSRYFEPIRVDENKIEMLGLYKAK